MRLKLPQAISIATVLALLALAGCGGGSVTASSSALGLTITPATSSIDTNCTGCNSTGSQGNAVEQFAVTVTGGATAGVSWAVAGGDSVSGAGSINASGQYTPPSYLTADRAQVVVTATLATGARASTVLTVTPGFLQPLTPENVALGANSSVTITGFLAEAGGSTGIDFALSNTAIGTSGGQGTLGVPHCHRGGSAFTTCSVTYTAPATLSGTVSAFVVASAGASAKTAAEVLLNTAGVSSNPTTHQVQLPVAVLLGTSGGNNRDYDASGSSIQDCCGGTLGALIQDAAGRQYLLSNNHVLARSDHAAVGDAIVQPGLIDNNCTPNGEGSGTTPVATLTGWLPLRSSQTNADAAIAAVASHAVDGAGSILELGSKQSDGLLAAAPPGVSSSGGKGESAILQMQVAKSGRTTGLTCGSVSALALDVSVDYYQDCAETKSYLTKTFSNQIAISGNQFSDAGDSGSLVVDTANAEPIGLFFAGGVDAAGVSQGVANPAGDVLGELSSQIGGGASYTFVGSADHAVSCLNYGYGRIASAQARTLSEAEFSRGQQALGQARALVNPRSGILGVATGKSNDHPGEAAVVIYVDEAMAASAPATVGGVRTIVIPTNARAVAYESAPQTPAGTSGLSVVALIQATAIKQQLVQGLMRSTPAFFGVGVGQSLDNPREAALVVYVDRKHVPAQLPQAIGGLRTQYVVMDRLHVTRSYAAHMPARSRCVPHPATSRPQEFDLMRYFKPRTLHID